MTTGTVDAWAEATSVGVRAPGDVMLMYGTTMFFVQVLTDPRPHPVLWGTCGAFPDTYTQDDHRHVERRGAGRGEDIAVGGHVGVHAVGKQAHQRLALADLDVQRSPVGDIGNRFIHESVAGDQSFDTRQVHRINCRAECLDSGM